MPVQKAFVMYSNGTGDPVSGLILRLKDNAGIQADVELTEAGSTGIYFSPLMLDGYWKVFDVTAGGAGTDTGYRVDAAAFLTREPAVTEGSSLHFYAGNKVFRAIVIEDIEDLADALSDEADARANGDSNEASARTTAVNALAARIGALEEDQRLTIPNPNFSDGTTTVAAAAETVLKRTLFSGGAKIIGCAKIPLTFLGMVGANPVRLVMSVASLFPVLSNPDAYFGTFTSNEVDYGAAIGNVEIFANDGTTLVLMFKKADRYITWEDDIYPSRTIR